MYYENSIMLVKVDDEFSSIFIPKLGVRQGGVASLKLFAIFIEDVVTSTWEICSKHTSCDVWSRTL